MTDPEPLFTSEAFRRDRRRSAILIAVIAALAVLPALAVWTAVRQNHGVLYGPWYFGYLAGIGCGCLAGALGLWRQRRWGAWTIWGTLISDLAFTAFLGDATVFSAALPVGLCLAIALEYRELE